MRLGRTVGKERASEGWQLASSLRRSVSQAESCETGTADWTYLFVARAGGLLDDAVGGLPSSSEELYSRASIASWGRSFEGRRVGVELELV